ncbi:MAG: hypothetical protein Q8P20_09735 [bacterium]|nr:hypothetical protein [bacterium]
MYVKLSRACTFQHNGIKFESKNGRLILNLQGTNITKCDLDFQRISGNGRVIIETENASRAVMIASKLSQIVSIDIENKLEIRRPGNSSGEIILRGVTAHYTGQNMEYNWKEIIKQCGTHKRLRMVNDKLFATAGAFIEDDNSINEIETNPLGMHQRDGNKIKFIGDCEIIKIKISNKSISKTAPYAIRNAPTPIITAPMHFPISTIKIANISNTANRRQQNIQTEINNNIVFNSSALKAFAKFVNIKNKLVKTIRSNGKDFLLLRNGAQCSISLSNIEDNTEYIVIIKAKRLNGNGKLSLALSGKENDHAGAANVIISGSAIVNKYVTLKTSTCQYGQFHKLNLSACADGCGEILIEEIVILNNIGVNRTQGLIEHTSTSKLHCPFNADDDNIDTVYQISKQYARYVAVDTDEKIFSIEGSAFTTTSSGMNWINKINQMLPNCKLIQNADDINNKTLMIGKIGSLYKAKRIWIDSFFESEITNNDLSILNDADTIYSPSLPNIQLLQSKFPNIKIECCARLNPYIVPKNIPYFSNKEFVLCVHRSNGSSHKIISSWKANFPKLVLVGARGNFPDNVIPVNEYLPYNELLYLISKCKFLIDIPVYTDYDSALLDLAKNMGVPIVSSNWSALENDNCVFLPATENLGLYRIPTAEAITDGIMQGQEMSRGPNKIDAYKNNFNNNLKKLFSS